MHRHLALFALALIPACKSPAAPVDEPTSSEPALQAPASAPLPKDLTPLHQAVIDGDPDQAYALRLAGEDPDVAVAGRTALDLAFEAWDRAADSENWSPSPDTLPELTAMLDACPTDPKLLESVIDALIRELPADAESTKLVEAWFAAANAGDATAAAKLGTPAWVQEERDWKPSFSRAVFKDGVRFESFEITGTETEGDLTIVKVRAKLLRPDGSTDGEGMTFKLQRFEKELLIVELR